MRLHGKVALITGGAKGIGGATASLFATEGAKVIVGDIDGETGKNKVKEIREGGGDAYFLLMDVKRAEDWRHAVHVSETLPNYGRLDILVNNAGAGNRAALLETTEEAWEEMMEVNAKSCFLGMKYVIPVMQRNGGGSIVNLSSIFGIVGSTTSAAYHAAKGAVSLLTKAAAVQHALDNIRVNSVYPGFTITPGTAAVFSCPEIAQARISQTPMRRFGTPEEIAYGILFFASDESSFCTGSGLVLDGGATVW